MLVALVVVVMVVACSTLVFATVLALTSARSLQRAVGSARQQLLPQVEELALAAQRVAERAQELRP